MEIKATTTKEPEHLFEILVGKTVTAIEMHQEIALVAWIIAPKVGLA